MVSCNQNDKKQFEVIRSSESGIDFNNKVVENADANILDYPYFYNGGGVSVGDDKALRRFQGIALVSPASAPLMLTINRQGIASARRCSRFFSLSSFKKWHRLKVTPRFLRPTFFANRTESSTRAT